MKFHRRQLILASLVLALGTAIYLNWQFSDNHGLVSTDIFRPEKEIGEARYVNSSGVSDSDNSEQQKKQMNTSNISDNTKEYFTKAKLERQKSRDESIEVIKSSLTDAKIDEESKKNCLDKINKISQEIQQEVNIENLIKAKGFNECLCILRNDECNIIVPSGDLNESATITIRDIVLSQSKIPFNKIKIIEAK